MKRFKKDQLIYQTGTNYAVKDFDEIEYRLFRVVERKVDSCGEKRVTFYNRGGNNDWLFGRSCSPDSANLHDTKEKAFIWLRKEKERQEANQGTRRKIKCVIDPIICDDLVFKKVDWELYIN